ncbi:ABC transporter ATP-binding protein [Streptomyces sp. NPDC059740]|uniref:ABC transporter ATP-binding protein n=1 Tax=Streptomyces sp. NPDC059740 TaxID=3346926 RepID=UPI00365882C9
MIEIERLTKRYPVRGPAGKGGQVTALDGLTVSVGEGVTGLVGSNGAGKSTLLKVLLGLSPATEGQARVLGRDVAREGAAIREAVGYMPEHDCLPPDVSATEFVVHMARMSGLPPAAARERTADVLRHVGLHEERYRPVGGYSTGMRQRVKLAQALVHDPRLVFLDEPTNGLDPVGRDEMLALIRRVHRDFGISVLVTSHLLGELERTCDHVVIIDGGTLLRSSATDDFVRATTSLAVEVNDTARCPDATAALHTALRSRGVAVEVPGGADVTLAPGTAGRVLYVEAADPATSDVIRDAVVDLGAGLVRMEVRRHRISEVFQEHHTGPAPAATRHPAPSGAPRAVPDHGGTSDAP